MLLASLTALILIAGKAPYSPIMSYYLPTNDTCCTTTNSIVVVPVSPLTNLRVNSRAHFSLAIL